MDSQRWQRVVEVYERAAEQDPSSRSSFLEKACEGDVELHREVQSLLDQNVTEPGLLETVAAWSVAPLASIGSYRILGLIGEGGMGAVYEAEQENPRRSVALKVVRPGLAVPEVLRRFEQESNALARLQHQGIAQIYEAGVAGGRPYFAMERIRGRGLMEHAATHKLATPQRLDLMIKICEAVEHAHQRGVIHRDLKPGNILVDETGQPKILDFGIARITDADAQATRGTDFGKLLGTLAYMSPEQVTADPSELDARSDVYALGLILYELLAGRAPYETGRNLTEAARVICEQEPLPLGRTNREFRGDLETIATKALEKDKARRYASAADLASDLRRHLADQPILARPTSTFYVTRKMVVRHKALTGALLAVFIAMSAGTVISLRQAARARRAEQTANAVNDFLQNDLLGQASPVEQAGPNAHPDLDLTVRTALDRAAARIPGKFDAQPEVEAAIQQTIGNAYRDLGIYAEAEQHMQRSLDLRRRALGDTDPDTLTSMDELGKVELGAGKYDKAEALLAPLLELRRQKLGSLHPDTLTAMNNLAGVIYYRGDYARAAQLRAEVLEGDRRLLGADHPYTLIAISNLASSYSSLGRYAEAADLYRQKIEVTRRVMGADHPSTFATMNLLAATYRDQGKYAEAEDLLNKVVEGRRRVLGDQHHHTLLARYTLALVYLAQERYADAQPLLEHGLETSRRNLPDHPDTMSFMASLAEVYWKTGRIPQAEELFGEALANRRRVLPPNHPSIARTLASMGEMKLSQKQYADAETLLRQANVLYQKTPLTDWYGTYTQAMLGAALAGLGRVDEAAPLLTTACEALQQKRDSIPADRMKVVDTALYWKSQIH